MIRVDTLTLAAGRRLNRFCADQNGATAIEYAMIASGVGGFLAAAIFALGGTVKNLYGMVAGLFP